MIANCIETLRWCDEIIIVDDGSTDQTVQIAKILEVKALEYKGNKSFAAKRNFGLSNASGDWVFYIDADERVTPKLKTQIINQLQNSPHAAFKLRRQNIHYGKLFQHGGWQDDWVEKIFKKSTFSKWTGEIHESPHYSGTLGVISQPLIHLTHRNMKNGLLKTIKWTAIEATLLHESGIPKVTAITLVRKTIMEFVRRYFFKLGFQDGIEGLIESITQAFNKFIIYERVWELQQKPTLRDKYSLIEKQIVEKWSKKRICHPRPLAKGKHLGYRLITLIK